MSQMAIKYPYKYICDYPACGKKYTRSSALKKHKIKHNLNRQRSFNCALCPSAFFHKDGLNQHNKVVHTDPHFACKFCRKEFKAKYYLEGHIRFYHLKEYSYSCTHSGCESRFPTSSSLHRHLNAKHVAKEDKVKAKCSKCSKKFAREIQLQNHFKNVHLGKGEKCQVEGCHKSFDTKNELYSHLSSHSEERPFSCPHCLYSAKTARGLKIHQEFKHDSSSKPKQCPKCPKTFKHRVSLSNHLKTHEPNRIKFECDLCSKSYYENRSLKIHEQVHHPQIAKNLENFNCHVAGCNRTFLAKCHLLIHIRNMHGTKKMDRKLWKCYFCDELIGEKTDHYIRHHTKERPFKCHGPLCRKTFPSNSQLKLHQAQHTAVALRNKFPCSKCPNVYLCKGSLKKHVAFVHEKKSGFKCTICNSLLITKTTLDLHIRAVHTKEKPFSCELCNFSTAYSQGLRIHKKRFHEAK